jgi:hypothetical protein
VTFSYFNDDVFSFFDNIKISEAFFPIYLTDDALYFLVEPYYLIQTIENKKNSRDKEWLKIRNAKQPFFNLINSLRLEDNPILIKYNFTKKMGKE